jgi:hypothetical protein
MTQRMFTKLINFGKRLKVNFMELQGPLKFKKFGLSTYPQASTTGIYIQVYYRRELF